MYSEQIDKQLKKVRAGILAKPGRLLIDGEWVEAQSGETLDVLDPSTREVIGKVAAGAAADVDRAVKAARRAFETGPWPSMPAGERARLMWKLAEAIEQNGDELATLESLNGGNPFASNRFFDVMGAAERLRYNAGWTNKIGGHVPLAPPAGGMFSFSIREPIGVVGAIIPWNAPLFMAVGKIAPAIAAGCTIVLKPAELTPFTALRVGELAQEVGFPPGVINIVTGYGGEAGAALVDHRDVDKISFTGSTRVGKMILASSADRLKRVTLELGGKSPYIIFADADVDAAARAAANGIFLKTGQFCAAGTRVFAHRAVYDRVVATIAAAAERVRIGNALSDGTEMGPIISEAQLARVRSYVQAGVEQGAELVAGSAETPGGGYFHPATVLAGATPGMSVMTDEIFGPVLCVMPFDDENGLDEIAAMANDTDYGLAAYLWTRDVGTVHRMTRRIRAGSISVNGARGAGNEGLPFGGFKSSGIGREGGNLGVEGHTEIKTVNIAL
ncbi:MAG TPA: aldehyde dehydrogenase family protein [Allosphingosinicella sp.]|jgi:phenylacetaldehyde dehydrogenase